MKYLYRDKSQDNEIYALNLWLIDYSYNPPEEEWAICTGYRISYEISNIGRVRKANTKHLLNFYVDRGYIHVRLKNKKFTYSNVKVHRLVAKYFLPNTENKEEVHHKNRIRYDNVYSNLEWNTQKENIRHNIRKAT